MWPWHAAAVTDVRVGVGLAPADITLDLGDLHPSGHGAFRLDCRFEGDTVVAAEPRPGLLHRGAEKLLEVRDYRQGLMLANRHDWLSAVTSEVTLALAVEDLLGLHVPTRATWLRTLLCEINRAAASLLHLAGAASLPPLGSPALGSAAMKAREAWLTCLESFSGGRVHTMVARIGGIAYDVPAGWDATVRSAISITHQVMPEVVNSIESAISPDVALLDAEAARHWSVCGPVARASGIDRDLRRDSPSLAYPELADHVRVIVAHGGDARSRYRVLADQVMADLDLIEACLGGLPEGPIDVRLPKIVRAAEGSSYAWLESATGANGTFVVSTGGTTPWRVRLRTASYSNVQAMAAALPGTSLADLPAAIGSFLFVAGDLDH
jgi:NADH-quinone oxidoreductase subunit D